MNALHVMDADFTLRAEITGYRSLRIKRCFRAVGEFEIHAPAMYAPVLTPERILFPVGAPEKAVIIEQTARSGEEVTAKGVTLSGLTRRRICVPGMSSEGSYGYDRIIADAESVLKHYVEANMTAPEDEKRRIEALVLEENGKRGLEGVPWSARFEALDEVLESICTYADCGYDIVPDFGKRRLVLRYLPGRDLTGTGARWVTFSHAFGNVSTTSYTHSMLNFRSTAYVGGAGEDEGRMILSIGEAKGLARRELWVDAGSESDTEELRYQAERKLSEKAAAELVEAKVIAAGAARYGEDWDLGDKVTVIAEGMRMDARITQIQESHEAGKPLGIDVTFGEPMGGVMRAVREAGRQLVR